MVTSISLWEWRGLQRLLLLVRIFEPSKSFIGNSSFYFVFGMNVVFLIGSATS
jgi:hypothetical protein